MEINEEEILTTTSLDQLKVEQNVANLYELFDEVVSNNSKPILLRNEHINYCLKGIQKLESGFQTLDASRPWLCYWILHALDLLGGLTESRLPNIFERTVDFLNRCQSPMGGFGGGPGQLPHLAPTYASVNALMICGTEIAYKVINRENIYSFLLSLKDPTTGAFIMHHDGEIDWILLCFICCKIT